jgi:hypothetical protein
MFYQLFSALSARNLTNPDTVWRTGKVEAIIKYDDVLSSFVYMRLFALFERFLFTLVVDPPYCRYGYTY